MPTNILEEILKTTKFTQESPNTKFLPKRVGLGYEVLMEDNQPSILKPTLKKINLLKREENKIENQESSSEDISKAKYIQTKVKKHKK